MDAIVTLLVVSLPTLSTVASCPDNITVGSLSPTSANVSWHLNVTNSTVCQNVSAHSDFATITTGSQCDENLDDQFTRIVSGLCPQTDYTFTVSILNSECPTLKSSPFNINATLASGVTNLMATANINTSEADPSSSYRIMAMVSWDMPATVNCNSTHYTLRVFEAGVTSAALSTNVSDTQYTINEGLMANTVYTVTVWLNTLAGPGETVMATFTQNDEPSAPIDNRASEPTTSSIRFSWNMPTRPNGNSITYNVYFNRSSTGNSEMVQTTSQLFSRISELNGYEMVCVTVSARNSVGEGPRSAQTCARALETAPGKVSQLTYGRISTTTIAVSWNIPEQPNGIILDYRLTLTRAANVHVSTKNYMISTPAIVTLDILAAFTQYTITVRARTEAGLGKEASLVNVFTAQNVPDMVNDVTARRVSHTSMIVSWAEPSAPMSETLGYEVTYNPLGSLGNEESVSINGDITTKQIGNIEPNLAYNVRVRALSVMGYGPYSSTESISVLKQPPSGPFTNGVLQLCLSGQLSCSTDNSTLKDMVRDSLSSQLQSYCDCQQLLTQETRLVCNNNRQQVVFRMQLSAEEEDHVYQTVRQWILSPGAFLRVNNHVAWVDASCPVLIGSLSSGAGLESSGSSDVGVASGILTTLLLLVIIALIAACIIIVLLWLERKQRNKDDHVESSKPSPVRYVKKPANDSYEYLDIGDQQATGGTAAACDDSNTYEIPDLKSNWRNSKKKKRSTNAGSSLPTSYQNIRKHPPAAANKGKKTQPKPMKPTQAKTLPNDLPAATAAGGNVHNIDTLQQQVPPPPPPPTGTTPTPNPPPPPPPAAITPTPNPPPPPPPPTGTTPTPNPPPPPPPTGTTPTPNPPPTAASQAATAVTKKHKPLMPAKKLSIGDSTPKLPPATAAKPVQGTAPKTNEVPITKGAVPKVPLMPKATKPSQAPAPKPKPGGKSTAGIEMSSNTAYIPSRGYFNSANKEVKAAKPGAAKR